MIKALIAGSAARPLRYDWYRQAVSAALHLPARMIGSLTRRTQILRHEQETMEQDEARWSTMEQSLLFVQMSMDPL